MLYVASYSDLVFSFFMMTSSNGNIFPRYWPFVRGIPLAKATDVFFDLRLINALVNTREAGDLRHHRAHYYVIVIWLDDARFRYPN